MKFLWIFALVTIVASTVCRKDSDCKPGDECNKGQCEKNRLVVIPSNCGSNQEWKACATCEPTCEDPTPMCTRECKPAQCQCAKNFVKYYERCIPLKECPNKSTTTSRPPTTTRTSTTDECRFDKDCPSGFACGHGFCSPLERVSTKAPNQAGVRKGNLLDDCRGDDDCRSDLHCSNSRCIFRPTTRRPLSRPTTEETFTAPPVIGLSGMLPTSAQARASNEPLLLSELLSGEQLRSVDGSAVHPHNLDNGLTALFICAQWSFPCNDILPALKKFNDALLLRGQPINVVYVSKDEKEDEYHQMTSEFPRNWVPLPFKHPKTDQILTNFNTRGIPNIPLLNNGRVVAKDIRPQLHFGQNEDPMVLLAKLKGEHR